MNKLFYASLKKYTHHPFELIIIDNHSTDGSADFFRSKGAHVIRNDHNYSYPYCQNQGIHSAKFEYLAFLNNDIVVSPFWDKRLIEILHARQLQVVTSCGIERMEEPAETKKMGRRWKAIKNTVSVLGNSEVILRCMMKMMYGDWEKFCNNRFERFGTAVVEGFIGNTILMRREVLDKIGLWDERIQAADFDLYIRMKKRNLEKGDVRPVHIALGVFNHHFIRLTMKSKPPVFTDAANILPLEAKWTPQELSLYLADNVET